MLRFTKDGSVGLTKEGGACCKANKGPVVEYHYLVDSISLRPIEINLKHLIYASFQSFSVDNSRNDNTFSAIISDPLDMRD